jgi:AraC-like DNA-binding protein
MVYQTFVPPDILSPYVKYFWALTSANKDHTPKTFKAFVDGSPGIMIVQSDKEAFCDENRKKLPEIFVYGQVAKPVSFTTQGDLNTIGICFQPHALKSVFGINAFELTDACSDITLMNKKSDDLYELLVEEKTIQNRIKIVSKYLIDLIKVNERKVDNPMLYAISEIVNTKGAVPLRELQRQLQLSERSLERKFSETVGIPPKFFSRICQFQATMNQIRSNNYNNFSDLAFQNNYSDQSHFIRVFKEFTGLLPLEYRKESDELVENFPQLKK